MGLAYHICQYTCIYTRMLTQSSFAFVGKVLGASHRPKPSLCLTSPADLEKIFSNSFSPSTLKQPPGSRRRHFSLKITFWSFLFQVINPNQSCREALRHLQAKQFSRHKTVSDSNTSAYCQARFRLSMETLVLIFQQVRLHLRGLYLSCDRPVKLIDTTTFSMPDTPCLQKLYPQVSGQKKGCGFPLIKSGAIFDLSTGVLEDFQSAPWRTHDTSLGQLLISQLSSGSILIGDRAFGSFEMLLQLQVKDCDFVGRLHQARKFNPKKAKSIGVGDYLTSLPRPFQRRVHVDLPILSRSTSCSNHPI
ncbi:MAG: transposase [Verrucomicrobiota bacterium]